MIAITLNANPVSEPCPLCGNPTNPNIGPELTNQSGLVVCRDCGRHHAPALVALLSLGMLATDFHLCQQDYGDMWLASRPVGLRLVA